MPDVNFDKFIDRFRKNVYGSLKGRIRQETIEQQFLEHLSILKKTSITCADIGGGLGQVTHWLASRGHSVDYFDLSKSMTKAAQETLDSENNAKLNFYQGPFQHLLEKNYDLVHCQAVIEWLEKPMDGIDRLCEHVNTGGYLALTFFNRESIVFKNLIKGNYRQAFKEDLRGDGTGLTPQNPLVIDEVFERLKSKGLDIEHWFGVRTFSDYLHPHVNKNKPVLQDAIVESELRLCVKEPYRSLARYIGVIARKPTL